MEEEEEKLLEPFHRYISEKYDSMLGDVHVNCKGDSLINEMNNIMKEREIELGEFHAVLLQYQYIVDSARQSRKNCIELTFSYRSDGIFRKLSIEIFIETMKLKNYKVTKRSHIFDDNDSYIIYRIDLHENQVLTTQ